MSARQTATEDPGSRAQEFVPVEGGGETTSAEALLVTAYLVMWALLVGFIAVGWRRQGRVDARLAELEKAVGAAPGAEARRS